jgi:hypothetical protein
LKWLVHATQDGIRARDLKFESWRLQLNKIIELPTFPYPLKLLS